MKSDRRVLTQKLGIKFWACFLTSCLFGEAKENKQNLFFFALREEKKLHLKSLMTLSDKKISSGAAYVLSYSYFCAEHPSRSAHKSDRKRPQLRSEIERTSVKNKAAPVFLHFAWSRKNRLSSFCVSSEI